jgi:L-rhamnose-H+ transport protein
MRERHQDHADARFSFRKGVPLAVLAGTLSAVFNFALIAGEPLETAALEAGASNLLRMNAIYPFSHGGAWLTNAVWCLFLIGRNGTGSQLVRLSKPKPGRLPFYYLMAILSGAMWYFQFFFYGMGHTNMGTRYGFTSWAVHMAMLILFSNVYGKLFREWEGASPRPQRVLNAGMVVIVLATLVITYGNYLGELGT